MWCAWHFRLTIHGIHVWIIWTLWTNIFRMTIDSTSWLGMKFVILVVCHDIFDFVLAFAYMKPWCAYHILQYACPNCKTILVQERSTSNCILCQQLCLWNHYVIFFPFCCFMHVGFDGLGVDIGFLQLVLKHMEKEGVQQTWAIVLVY